MTHEILDFTMNLGKIDNSQFGVFAQNSKLHHVRSNSFARRFIRSWRALANSRVNSSQTNRSSAFFSRNSSKVNSFDSSASSLGVSSSPPSRSENGQKKGNYNASKSIGFYRTLSEMKLTWTGLSINMKCTTDAGKLL